MKLNLLFLTILILGSFNAIFGQEKWAHSFGLSGQQLSVQPLVYNYISNTQPVFLRQYDPPNNYYGTISYHIRRKLYAPDSLQLDFSLDVPLEVSAYWSNDEFEQKNYVNLGVPFMLNVNYGAFTFSKKKSEIPFGFFGGLGVLWQYTDGNLGNRTNFSPYSIIGLRIDFNKKYGLEISYAQNHFFNNIESNQYGDEYYTPDFLRDKSLKLQTRSFSIRIIL